LNVGGNRYLKSSYEIILLGISIFLKFILSYEQRKTGQLNNGLTKFKVIYIYI